MKELTVREIAERFNCAFDWPRYVVGIRFIFSEKDYDEIKAVELNKPINYCQMVRAASRGNCIKSKAEMHRCIAAARALGLAEVDEFHRSGNKGLGFQLYNDLGTAKYTRDRQTICDHKLYAVLVKPLIKFKEEERKPDIVQIITNPYYAMRIVQGYTYFYGIQTNFKMSGLQAVCSESTAYPYMSNNINISLLCGGTRLYCKWKDDEMMVSMPFNKFPLTVEGTLKTMNLQDSNEKKAIERQKLKDMDMYEEFPLMDNFSYCYLPSVFE